MQAKLLQPFDIMVAQSFPHASSQPSNDLPHAAAPGSDPINSTGWVADTPLPEPASQSDMRTDAAAVLAVYRGVISARRRSG